MKRPSGFIDIITPAARTLRLLKWLLIGSIDRSEVEVLLGISTYSRDLPRGLYRCLSLA